MQKVTGLGVVASATTISWPSCNPRSGDKEMKHIYSHHVNNRH